MKISRAIFLPLVFLATTSHITAAEHPEQTKIEASQSNHRQLSNIQRDTYRHPQQTLAFFGLQPEMTVVEIGPGGGWYTEVLAPMLRDKGQLYIAGFSKSDKEMKWKRKMAYSLDEKLAKHPDVYDKVIVTELMFPEQTDIAPEGSADMVLTFRNVHNWMKAGNAQEMFNLFAKTLKADGVLGVVEHRAKIGTSLEDMIISGYVTEAHVIELAKNAGLELATRSEINANSKDTTNHPKGVWTLQPSLRLCKSLLPAEKKISCLEKYTAIGESDRMTLRFRLKY